MVFSLVMQQRRICRFKAQRRWLVHHPEMDQTFGLGDVPDHMTLSRRSKALYGVLHDCVAFIGPYAEDLDPRFTSTEAPGRILAGFWCPFS